MYTGVLFIHSWLRWVVLLLGVIAIARAIAGSSARRPWNASDERVNKLFVRTVDVQFLLGLLLYIALSPFTRTAFLDVGAAMGNSGLRFWAVEHVLGMVVAIGLAEAGFARVRKTADPVRKHRVSLVFNVLVMLAMLISIPWPGMPAGRALFRW
jgi:hypothetical protein